MNLQFVSMLIPYLTKDNLTFFMSVIGFIGTIYGSIRVFYIGRKRIDCEIIDHVKLQSNIVQFFIYVNNSSSNPLCISYISLVYDDVSVRCELLQKKTRLLGGILYRTPLFPLNLAPHVGTICFLEFLKCPDIELAPDKTVVLEFHTNRGMIKKSLILPQPAHYLHIQ